MKDEDSLLDDPEDRDSGGDSDEVSTLPRCFQQTAQFDRCHFEKDWTQMIHDPNCAAQLCITFYFLLFSKPSPSIFACCFVSFSL